MMNPKNATVSTNAASGALGLGQGDILTAQMQQEEEERKKKINSAAGTNTTDGFRDPSGGYAGIASALGLQARKT